MGPLIIVSLEAAGHVSHSTLQRRLVQLEAAGVMHNAGTQMRPLWQVAGIDGDPEDALTERQQKVLALMRQEPPAKAPEIARAIGTSTTTVFATYKELAALGLAEKSANRWVALPREASTAKPETAAKTQGDTTGNSTAHPGNATAHTAAKATTVATTTDLEEKARILSRKGASEAMTYATKHPRATKTELLEASGVSYATLRNRLSELAKAGIMVNTGSVREPLWQVEGVKHDDLEDLLTERQRAVLACLRRDPPPGTTAMAAELGMSRSMAGYILQQLADLHLVAKAPNNRWYAVSKATADNDTGSDAGEQPEADDKRR